MSCTLVLEAFCPSSSSQARVFVEVTEARSESSRVRCGWGYKMGEGARDEVDRRRISRSDPTQDTSDSRAVDCVLVENRRADQEA